MTFAILRLIVMEAIDDVQEKQSVTRATKSFTYEKGISRVSINLPPSAPLKSCVQRMSEVSDSFRGQALTINAL